MYLKKIQLSGFKSFAKPTTLEFSSPITAVVGPNGSGKSNVAEAIQWVLGEQSLKSLRGKKGEDLIFAGSQSSPKLGRASVVMTFDNKNKKFNIDFDEVSIERHVFRDGVNEYLINGSKVRLKDVTELLANVGLGSSQHHIISQGESDRILYASPKERRGMIEDALGIKIYQLKRYEAERKLEHTEENMKQVASLRREIQPHLKFLRQQAEKVARSEEIRKSLKEKLKEYLGKEHYQISRLMTEAEEQKKHPAKELLIKESRIKELKNRLEKEEGGLSDNSTLDKELHLLNQNIANIRQKRSQLERDLGRLEGMIEAQKQIVSADLPPIKPEEIKDFFEEMKGTLRTALNDWSIENVHTILEKLLKDISLFLSTNKPQKTESRDVNNLIAQKERIEEALYKLSEEEQSLQNKYSKTSKQIQDSAQSLRGIERKLYELEGEASVLRDKIRTLEFNEERLKSRREDFNRDKDEAVRYLDDEQPEDFAEDFSDTDREKLRKDIERFKIKLEEAGGVDSSVIKEFEEVRDRDSFFEKELQDLGEAAGNLRKVIKDLEERLENDFKNGISKINTEFQDFFSTMFGGGRAELRIIKPKQKKREEEEFSDTDEGEDKEKGIDVCIDLPRKRIKSLDMLSGGERALSSIALLFALSAVNPPPFLVLDETDAALDEANSKKYGLMLESLAKNAQLIVITHNRESMQHAGILYGVTMSRDGISRLISVKLEEAEKIAK